jgi:hypothetical protein
VAGEGGIDVYLGLDVGKGEHHATALAPVGKKVFDKRLPNTEPKLREVFAMLQAKHGTVLVVVDQPASIGARRRPTFCGRSPQARYLFLIVTSLAFNQSATSAGVRSR